MKSAEARLHASGMFQTAAIRNKCFDIRIMRHRFQRIPEKDQEVDLIVNDHRADLLIAAQWAALQFCDFEIQARAPASRQ